MKDRCWATVNLSHIVSNVRKIKRIANIDNLMGVVKADAYGHGVARVSSALRGEVAAFCVATCDEGVELALLDADRDILVLQPIVVEESVKKALSYGLVLTVEDCRAIERIGKIAVEIGRVAKVNVAVDSNMHRLGVEIGDEATKVVECAERTEGVKIYGIFSHLNTTEKGRKLDTCSQKTRLRRWVQGLILQGIDTGKLHLSATDDALNDELCWGNAVRIGLGMYGYGEKGDKYLKPAMNLYSRVISLRRVKEGQSVGYDATWVADKDCTIATLAIGYADGYPITLSNKGRVYINGEYARIVGRVCMDTCMIDVSEIEGVRVGDVAQMWGDEVDLNMLADLGDTSVYELLAGLGKRIEKIYVE